MDEPRPNPHRDRPPLSLRDRLARILPARPVEILGPELVRTSRLELRPIADKDRSSFLEAIAQSRDELSRYYDLWHPGDRDDDVFRRQLALCHAGSASGKAWRRGAFTPSGDFVGCFNLCNIEHGLEETAEAGWWIRSDVGRLGLGREGVSALIQFALDTGHGGLGLTRVTALIHAQNTPSLRVAEHAGMTHAPNETASVLLNGQWVPHVVYSRSATPLGGMLAG